MTKSRKLKPKSSRFKVGTDEAFFKLMEVSGSSILKLLGIDATQAANYRFRATVLKDKKLQPDIEGIPLLQSDFQRVILEFQGYEDPFIRYRAAAETFWCCLPDQYTGRVLTAIIFLDKKHQEAALPLVPLQLGIPSQSSADWVEIVLSDYTEAELLAIDPKLVVLAPFTVAKDVDKTTLLNKGLQWQTQITQVFPLRLQRKVLDLVGLLILGRFSKLTYQEVRTMLNLDLNKSVAIREVRNMAMEKGLAKGLTKGLAEGRAKGLTEGLTKGRAEGLTKGLTKGRAEGVVEGRAEGLTKGLITGFQEVILETLTERFGRVSKPLSNQIRQIQQPDRLKQLQRQVLRCQNLSQFRQLLTAQAK